MRSLKRVFDLVFDLAHHAAVLAVGDCAGLSSTVGPDERLYADKEPHYICSPSGQYKFGLDPTDGDLALWDENTDTKIWSANTCCQDGAADTNLVVQEGDGNVVLYSSFDGISKMLWKSNTEGNPNATLAVDDNGEIKVLNGVEPPVILVAPNGVVGECPTAVGPDERLYADRLPHSICSPSGQYRFGLDPDDGDLALWDQDTATKIWSANTCCQDGATDINLVVQEGDGNVVLYSKIDGSTNVLWKSNTGGNPNATLTVEDDGEVRVRGGEDPLLVLWQAPTKVRVSLDQANRWVTCGHTPGTPPPPQISTTTTIDASTLHGKIMAGYQGWFDTECSGSPSSQWRHWSHMVKPDPTTYRFEMWPDMREYDDDELCPTGFTYRDGSDAGLFSSFNNKTVDRHVKWMSDYDIDGVFFQRFVNQLREDRCFHDVVLDNVRRASELRGRIFVNMYDISDAEEIVYDDIKEDWMYLVDTQEITKSRSYLHHKGRPLVSIWGFGFENRPGTPAAVAELIDWFHNNPVQKYRATLMAGVPSGWQKLTTGKTDPEWAQVYRMFDVLSPWSVGRYKYELGRTVKWGVDHYRATVTEPNIDECNSLGIDYLPVIWPGFSWSYKNMKDASRHEPWNKYPRQAGGFLWRQLLNGIEAFTSSNSPSKQIYVAMYDEVDEATAIFKVADSIERIPMGMEGKFLTYGADGPNCSVPSDFYLRLIGRASSMLRANGTVPSDIPGVDLPPRCLGPPSNACETKNNWIWVSTIVSILFYNILY